MPVLFHFLRARGYRVSVLSRMPLSPYEDRLNSLAERGNGMADIPRLILPVRGLRAALRHLSQPGAVLLVALDGYRGGRPVVARRAGVRLTAGPGAFVLAELARAALFPCLITSPRGLSAVVHVGRPAADATVADRRRHPEAAGHLLGEMVPVLRGWPEQCDRILLDFLGAAEGDGP
jgi:hypothetical protein